MTANERKNSIVSDLETADGPINATQLAKKLGVSRQVIVGDVAILRASGHNIIATPRGYLLQKTLVTHHTIAVSHSLDEMLEELYIIVDNGCSVLNVIIEHQIYGQIVGELHVYSRKDAEEFVDSMKKSKQEPLSSLTEQVHLHTIDCPSPKHYEDLKKELSAKGFLIT